MNYYDIGLDKNPANFQALTPISQLERVAGIYPEKIAIVHGDAQITYAQFWRRAKMLGSALHKAEIRRGDTVACLLANTPPMLVAHYGIPMSGAVINTINTRLDAATIRFILEHGEAKIILVDSEFSPLLKKALEGLSLPKGQKPPRVLEWVDCSADFATRHFSEDYTDFVEGGDEDFNWIRPQDEWDAISLSYTSGTTGNPKGVVTHHRGAALKCYANAVETGLSRHPVYLWTLPMFHCNGWSFTWAIGAAAGTHICLRAVRAKAIFDLCAAHKVTHLCGAPIVIATMINAPAAEKSALTSRPNFITGGAPPPEAVIAGMDAAGFTVHHLYGLTEVYGPAVINEWRAEWDSLPAAAQAALKSRQGVRYPSLEGMSVKDPETMQDVPADGKTIGELMLKGNTVMKGYFKNAPATQEAFAGGWFHTGDLAVMHPDGYVQIRDRSKDIIISGGENISSIEVEDVLFKHPAVSLVAVVARPDEKWGESPCAFVELKPGISATAEELLAFARQHLAGFKMPKTVIFTELPKTSTGKIQKFQLREKARTL